MGVRVFALLIALAAVPVLPAGGGLTTADYRARREALRELLPPGAVAVMAGAVEAEKGDLRNGFLQDPDFVYLTGWREPGALMIAGHGEDVLFLPPRNEVRERYTGRKLAAGDAEAGKIAGFDKVEPATAFAAYVKKLAVAGAEFHTLNPAAPPIAEALGDQAMQGQAPKLARLRAIKSAREIELIQQSVDATVAAHKAAWRRVRQGLYEYQIAATMSALYFERGCERHAYPPIVASGPNSVILHYAANRRREVYEVVLGAQKAALAAAKPGMKLTGGGEDSLNRIAKEYVAKFGMEKYYVHGLGHHVGLRSRGVSAAVHLVRGAADQLAHRNA
ncbi:MAG: aminopeptidase P N-terminal domain-containing protein [Bryobacteraceae bacterium]